MSSLDPNLVISGLSGRFALSSSVDEMWSNLLGHVDMMNQTDSRRFQSGSLGTPQRTGFMKYNDVTDFDPEFFNVTPAVATDMDPQQRLLLTVTHEALLDAGLILDEIRGTNGAVIVGMSQSDFFIARSINEDSLNGNAILGSHLNLMSSRVAYYYGLRGFSASVDTACSASMTGIHMACEEILSGRSEFAIVCGAHLLVRPQATRMMQLLGMISPDGRSAHMSATANGLARSEAVNAIVITRPGTRFCKSAYARIRGWGANTDGYKLSGISAPSAEVQCNLIQQVYQRFGIDARKIAFWQMHGTGTPTGDPIEAAAIDSVLTQAYGHKNYIATVGSIKSNLGHSEPASGINSVIAMCLALYHRKLPTNLHFDPLNPNTKVKPLIEGRIKLLENNIENWETGLIAINSFGVGGTNAHLVIEPYNEIKSSMELSRPSVILSGSMAHTVLQLDSPAICFLSNRTLNGLSQMISTVKDRISTDLTSVTRLFPFLSHISSSTILRPLQPYRAAIFIMPGSNKLIIEFNKNSNSLKLAEEDSPIQTPTLLSTSSPGSAPIPAPAPVPVPVKVSAQIDSPPSLTYIFTGMGCQFSGMTKQFFSLPVYQSTFTQICSILSLFATRLSSSWNLSVNQIELLKSFRTVFQRSTDENFDENILLSSLSIVVSEICLFSSLLSFGVSPLAVVGHSVGEISALYSSGFIDLSTTIGIVLARSLALERFSNSNSNPNGIEGGMLAVNESLTDLSIRCDRFNLFIACHNSPQSFTVSGPIDSIDQLYKELKENSISASKVRTNGKAFHSPLIEGALENFRKFSNEIFNIIEESPEEFKQFNTSINLSNSPILISSSQLGKVFHRDSSLFPSLQSNSDILEYLCKNLREPVFFSGAVNNVSPSILTYQQQLSSQRNLYSDRIIFIEVSPNALFRNSINQILPGSSYFSLARKISPDLFMFFNTLSSLFINGVDCRNELKNISNPSRSLQLPRSALHSWKFFSLKYFGAAYELEMVKAQAKKHGLIVTNETGNSNGNGNGNGNENRNSKGKLKKLILNEEEEEETNSWSEKLKFQLSGIEKQFKEISREIQKKEFVGTSNDNSLSISSMSTRKISVDVFHDPEYHFLVGHIINGKLLCPGCFYLYLALKVACDISRIPVSESKFHIKNARFHAPVFFDQFSAVEFSINFDRISGAWSVSTNGELRSSGLIYISSAVSVNESESNPAIESSSLFPKELLNGSLPNVVRHQSHTQSHLINSFEKPLSREEFYSEMRLIGYDYRHTFKGISQIDHRLYSNSTRNFPVSIEFLGASTNFPSSNSISSSAGLVSFMDCLLQTALPGLLFTIQRLCVPLQIDSMAINVAAINSLLPEGKSKNQTIPATIFLEATPLSSLVSNFSSVFLSGFHFQIVGSGPESYKFDKNFSRFHYYVNPQNKNNLLAEKRDHSVFTESYEPMRFEFEFESPLKSKNISFSRSLEPILNYFLDKNVRLNEMRQYKFIDFLSDKNHFPGCRSDSILSLLQHRGYPINYVCSVIDASSSKSKAELQTRYRAAVTLDSLSLNDSEAIRSMYSISTIDCIFAENLIEMTNLNEILSNLRYLLDLGGFLIFFEYNAQPPNISQLKELFLTCGFHYRKSVSCGGGYSINLAIANEFELPISMSITSFNLRSTYRLLWLNGDEGEYFVPRVQQFFNNCIPSRSIGILVSTVKRTPGLVDFVSCIRRELAPAPAIPENLIRCILFNDEWFDKNQKYLSISEESEMNKEFQLECCQIAFEHPAIPGLLQSNDGIWYVHGYIGDPIEKNIESEIKENSDTKFFDSLNNLPNDINYRFHINQSSTELQLSKLPKSSQLFNSIYSTFESSAQSGFLEYGNFVGLSIDSNTNNDNNTNSNTDNNSGSGSGSSSGRYFGLSYRLSQKFLGYSDIVSDFIFSVPLNWSDRDAAVRPVGPYASAILFIEERIREFQYEYSSSSSFTCFIDSADTSSFSQSLIHLLLARGVLSENIFISASKRSSTYLSEFLHIPLENIYSPDVSKYLVRIPPPAFFRSRVAADLVVIPINEISSFEYENFNEIRQLAGSISINSTSSHFINFTGAPDYYFRELERFSIFHPLQLIYEGRIFQNSFHRYQSQSRAASIIRNELKIKFQTWIDNGIVPPLTANDLNYNESLNKFNSLTDINSNIISNSNSNINSNLNSNSVQSCLTLIDYSSFHLSSLLKDFSISTRTEFSSSLTFIIAGGFGGVGFEFVQYLISRGARYLVVPSRSGASTGRQLARLNYLRSIPGVHLIELKADFSKSIEEIERALLIDLPNNFPPLGGFFHFISQLNDRQFLSMTPQQFDSTVKSKANTAFFMDEFTVKHKVKLNYFVIISSIAGSYGSENQSNYGYGNASMETLVRRRIEREKLINNSDSDYNSNSNSIKNNNNCLSTVIQLGGVRDLGIIADIRIRYSSALGKSSPIKLFDLPVYPELPEILLFDPEICADLPLRTLIATIDQILFRDLTSSLTSNIRTMNQVNSIFGRKKMDYSIQATVRQYKETLQRLIKQAPKETKKNTKIINNSNKNEKNKKKNKNKSKKEKSKSKTKSKSKSKSKSKEKKKSSSKKHEKNNKISGSGTSTSSNSSSRISDFLLSIVNLFGYDDLISMPSERSLAHVGLDSMTGIQLTNLLKSELSPNQIKEFNGIIRDPALVTWTQLMNAIITVMKSGSDNGNEIAINEEEEKNEITISTSESNSNSNEITSSSEEQSESENENSSENESDIESNEDSESDSYSLQNSNSDSNTDSESESTKPSFNGEELLIIQDNHNPNPTHSSSQDEEIPLWLQLAELMGYSSSSPDEIPLGRSLQESGFDSMTGIQVKNLLKAKAPKFNTEIISDLGKLTWKELRHMLNEVEGKNKNKSRANSRAVSRRGSIIGGGAAAAMETKKFNTENIQNKLNNLTLPQLQGNLKKSQSHSNSNSNSNSNSQVQFSSISSKSHKSNEFITNYKIDPNSNEYQFLQGFRQKDSLFLIIPLSLQLVFVIDSLMNHNNFDSDKNSRIQFSNLVLGNFSASVQRDLKEILKFRCSFNEKKFILERIFNESKSENEILLQGELELVKPSEEFDSKLISNETDTKFNTKFDFLTNTTNHFKLFSSEIYQEFACRKLEYSGLFQCLKSAKISVPDRRIISSIDFLQPKFPLSGSISGSNSLSGSGSNSVSSLWFSLLSSVPLLESLFQIPQFASFIFSSVHSTHTSPVRISNAKLFQFNLSKLIELSSQTQNGSSSINEISSIYSESSSFNSLVSNSLNLPFLLVLSPNSIQFSDSLGSLVSPSHWTLNHGKRAFQYGVFVEPEQFVSFENLNLINSSNSIDAVNTVNTINSINSISLTSSLLSRSEIIEIFTNLSIQVCYNEGHAFHGSNNSEAGASVAIDLDDQLEKYWRSGMIFRITEILTDYENQTTSNDFSFNGKRIPATPDATLAKCISRQTPAPIYSNISSLSFTDWSGQLLKQTQENDSLNSILVILNGGLSGENSQINLDRVSQSLKDGGFLLFEDSASIPIEYWKSQLEKFGLALLCHRESRKSGQAHGTPIHEGNRSLVRFYLAIKRIKRISTLPVPSIRFVSRASNGAELIAAANLPTEKSSLSTKLTPIVFVSTTRLSGGLIGSIRSIRSEPFRRFTQTLLIDEIWASKFLDLPEDSTKWNENSVHLNRVIEFAQSIISRYPLMPWIIQQPNGEIGTLVHYAGKFNIEKRVARIHQQELKKIHDSSIIQKMINSPSNSPSTSTTSSTTYSSSKYYILIGGLSGVAQELLRWMADRGARHFILTSRFGLERDSSKYSNQPPLSGINCLKFHQWTHRGLDIQIFTGDINSSFSQCEELFRLIPSNSSLGGIFHLAMVVSNRFLSELTPEQWEIPIRAKVPCVVHIDKLLEQQQRNSELDFFVVFSSVACAIGVATEANYSYACGELDEFMRNRQRRGFKNSFSIQLGIIGDVGYMAGIFEKRRQIGTSASGMENDTEMSVSMKNQNRGPVAMLLNGHYCDPQPISSLMEYLEAIMQENQERGNPPVLLLIARLVSNQLYNALESEETRRKLEIDYSANTNLVVNSSKYPPRSAYTIGLRIPGRIDSAYFKPYILPTMNGVPNAVQIEVRAVSLNFKDFLMAKGLLDASGLFKEFLSQSRLTNDHPSLLNRYKLSEFYESQAVSLGLDVSGVVTAVGEGVTEFSVGDEIVAGNTCGTLSTRYVIIKELLSKKPPNVSFFDASAIPTVFCTAYCGLIEKARIQPGEILLIHSAAGAVGQACIQLAQLYNCTVIASCSSESKRQYLRDRYGVKYFVNSRSVSEWRQSVLELTENRGVDVVMNSLAGEAIEAGIEVLKAGGRMVEIGKMDMMSGNSLNLKLFIRDVSLLSCQMDFLNVIRPDQTGRILREVMKLFEQGKLSSIVEAVYPAQPKEISKAIKHLADGTHIGKLVIDFDRFTIN